MADGWSAIVRDLVLGASAFAIGCLVYVTGLNARVAVKGRREAWYYVTARLGMAGALYLVAEAVARAPGVTPTWRAWAYIVFLTLISIGFVGIAATHHRAGSRDPV